MPGSGSAHAIAVDVDTFGGLPPNRTQRLRADELAERGWMVVLVDAKTTVPDAWQGLQRAAEVLG